MNRPLISRLLPNRFKETIYYRKFHYRHSDYPDLFVSATLAFAPRVSMYNLVVGDTISGNIAFHGFYELTLSERIVQLANHGGTLVDVGANMGYFSLLWTASNPTANAITFEAAPRNIVLLNENIQRNQLSSRITQISKAAGRQSGRIDFELGPAEQTGWGGISNAATATTIEVPIVRLDEELPDQDINVLKIDVEGADTWVLFGCEQLLKRKRIQHIFFEQNDVRMAKLGIDANEAPDFLDRFDYECVLFGAGEWFACPKAKKTSP